MKFLLNQDIEFYILDKNNIALFDNGSLFTLEGEDVEQYLIPLLSSNDLHFDSDELMKEWNCSEEKISQFVTQLSEIKLIIIDDNKKVKSVEVNHHTIAYKHSDINELLFEKNSNLAIAVLFTDDRFLQIDEIIKKWNFSFVIFMDVSVRTPIDEI